MFKFGGKKNRWRDVDYLKLVPARHLTWEEDADTGQVTVLLPRYTDPVFGRLVQPLLSSGKRYLRVPLEDRGTYLWRLMDGHRTVADLVRAFQSDHPDDRDDAPTRISIYLHAMYDNKFINYLNLSSRRAQVQSQDNH